MTERPIIFSAPMVRAILAGRKTQTRRITRLQPFIGNSDVCKAVVRSTVRFREGDHLWVRETWTPETDMGIGYPPPHDDGRPIRWDKDEDGVRYWTQPHYRASDPEPDLSYPDSDGPACRWRPSIYMPRWASRLTLVVNHVHVQRLNDISDDDAIAEGCPAQTREELAGLDARGWFRDIWNSIHGPEAWSANPWVAAISFTLAERAIK